MKPKKEKAVFTEHDIYIMDVCIEIFLIIVLIFHYLKFPNIEIGYWLLIAASFIGVAPVVWSATKSAIKGEWASMDMLASVALLFSLLSGQWSSVVFIALMITSARILQEINEEKTKRSISGLLKLRPENAKIEKNGTVEIVRIEDIKVGDIVVVDLSERIPIDGEVVSGEATVDESSLTGESIPVEKVAGKKVSSSTLVVSGSIRVVTERVGEDTTLERIITLVESSREEKPEMESLGVYFGKIYLISVFLGSIILLLVTKNVFFVLAVVLVVCADDVAVAVPIAYLRAISYGAGKGIIIKGGKHLEALGFIDIIVFDKTGTLTVGKPTVSVIEASEGKNKEDVLRYAAIASRRSTHPLAKALVAYADEMKLSVNFPDSADIFGGRGVLAEKDGKRILTGNKIFLDKYNLSFSQMLSSAAEERSRMGESVSYVALDDEVIGFYSASDAPKENANDVIKKLERLGIKKVVMLTGDNEKVAKVMAEKLGIKNYYANLLPEDKVSRLKDLQKEGKVAMVGDGVNDAASLSISNVGIAMGALGTDGAIESAEIILMHDDLAGIPKVIQLARKVHKIAIQDFWIWGGTNLLGLILVFTGVIGHMGAAAYNFFSDFLPLFNSLRAKLK